MIKDRFGLDIPVFVISKEDLEDILQHAPDWWGDENKEIYDNLIFIMPPATFAELWGEIGEPKEGLEKIKDYKETVFWSFSRKDYQKTNWWPKTASTNISRKLTIRTANKMCIRDRYNGDMQRRCVSMALPGTPGQRISDLCNGNPVSYTHLVEEIGKGCQFLMRWLSVLRLISGYG